MTFFGKEPKTAAETMQEKIVYLNNELRAANQMIAVLRAELKFTRDSHERSFRIRADDFDHGHRE